MKVYYDLHIHSVLSACASSLQTPNNILNMCMIKGLNMISITDHNSLKQLKITSEIAESYGFLLLHGAEVTVKEGFHVLAYFKDLETALKFDDIIEVRNPKISYNSELGEQILTDIYDLEMEKINYKLNVPLDLDFKEMIAVVHKLGGVVIPAHIDRSSGILEVYSDFSNYNVDAIEIRFVDKLESLLFKYPYLRKYKILHSSDAHSLEIIQERKHFLNMKDLSFKSFVKAIKK